MDGATADIDQAILRALLKSKLFVLSRYPYDLMPFFVFEIVDFWMLCLIFSRQKYITRRTVESCLDLESRGYRQI